MNPFQYLRPADAKSATAALGTDPAAAQLIAGGTNLLDLMKRGVASPTKLVDISRLPLNQIEAMGDGGVRIGALATNTAAAEHPLVRERLPLLSQALHAGASPQLRNMATVGGNLLQRTRCPYFYDLALPCNKRKPGSGCGALNGYNRMHAIFGASESCIAVNPSDMSVALAALDATVVVTSGKKERRIAFPDFHRLPGDTPQRDTNLAPGELITAVEIPAGPFAPHAHYQKVRDRAAYAFALVSVAAAVQLDGSTIKAARLAFGGVAHKPWRLPEAEQALVGQPATEATFRKAAEVAMRGAKAYSHNAYKLKLAPNALVQALKTATGIG